MRLSCFSVLRACPPLLRLDWAVFRHFDTTAGTEELAHQEMIAAIVYQLTRNLTPEQIRQSGFDAYFVDHTTGIYPQSAAGVPFSASVLQCKGDALTDLFEDLAADAATVQEQHTWNQGRENKYESPLDLEFTQGDMLK